MTNFSIAVQEVINGNADPLEIYAEINMQIKFLEKCKLEIYEYALKEASNYGKNFEHKGFKFEANDGKRTFQFDHIDEWNKAKNHLKEIEQRYKVAYANFERGMSSVNEDGEVLDVPIIKYSKPFLTIKNI